MTILKKRPRPPRTQEPVSQIPSPKLVELNEKELAAIAGACTETQQDDITMGNHNETIVNAIETSQADAQSEAEQIVELDEGDLEAISGGRIAFNHNETLVSVVGASQAELAQIVELSEEDLETIAGGTTIEVPDDEYILD